MRITRTHEFDAGHRVAGHEGKCRNLHGHRYEVAFTVEANELDDIGRVVDFAVLKNLLCRWLDDNWDHHFLLWMADPLMPTFREMGSRISGEGAVFVPFNPTAENMAQYLLEVVGPDLLHGTGVKLVSVRVNETRKCSAEASL